MKDVWGRLNKTYDKRIVDHKQIKKQWKQQKEHLIELGIHVQNDEDAMYFQYEIILNSITTKETFEDIFLSTYVTMYDYWYDLTYQERKKQMNIDIDKIREAMKSFVYENQRIYMPCFNTSFNHLYTDEIVLLDLKQYHVFIRNYAKEITYDTYGVLPFLHEFSSAQVLLYRGDDFVLYHELMNRFYIYKNKKFYKAVSMDPKQRCEDRKVQEEIALALLEEDEDALIKHILKQQLVSKHMCKKLTHYQQKKAKRIAKQLHKEEKK